MDLNKLLIEGADRLGVSLSALQSDSFARYLSELLKWNAKVNLTAIDDPREVVIKHFLDSLSLCALLPAGPFRAADIGSGAGFPGLALKIARPDMELTLIEPARKKATFLRHIIRLLGLTGVSVVDARVENLGPEHIGRYDAVFSRAFKEPGELLPLARPLIAHNGIVVLSLGPETAPAAIPGWEVSHAEEITLPYSGYKRRLMAYKKTDIS